MCPLCTLSSWAFTNRLLFFLQMWISWLLGPRVIWVPSLFQAWGWLALVKTDAGTLFLMFSKGRRKRRCGQSGPALSELLDCGQSTQTGSQWTQGEDWGPPSFDIFTIDPRSIWVYFCVWCKIWIQFIFFPNSYPAVPAPFIKKSLCPSDLRGYLYHILNFLKFLDL